MFLIIADWDENNRPTKINTKETEAEAITLVDKLRNELGHPNAFYVADYNGMDTRYCVVDPVTQTITYDTAGEAQDVTDANWVEVRAERDRRIDKTMWRIQRWERTRRTGRDTQDAIVALDNYVDALCDVPADNVDPTNINWPAELE